MKKSGISYLIQQLNVDLVAGMECWERETHGTIRPHTGGFNLQGKSRDACLRKMCFS